MQFIAGATIFFPLYAMNVDVNISSAIASATHLSVAESHTLHGRVHHNALVVLRQQQVTSATYYYIRCSRIAQNLSHFQRLIHALILQKPAALGINAKCIMLLQTIIPEIPHYSLFTIHYLYVVIFISSQRSPTFLKRSSTS